MHERVSVSGLCFPELPAPEAIEAIAGLGVASASLTGAKARAAGAGVVAAAARRHGVTIVTTTGALAIDLSSAAASAASRQLAEKDIDLAAAVGAATMYGLTGPRTSARWDACADAYVNAIGDLAGYAAARGVTLAIEPTSWLYSDLTFVHTFHDALLVAPRAGMGICLDAFHVWTEAGLREEIGSRASLIAHVPLSDMTRGSRSLEVGLAGGAEAGGEGALFADLDQAAESFSGLVGAGVVAVVAVMGGHQVEPDDQLPSAGQRQCPAAGFLRCEFPVARWCSRWYSRSWFAGCRVAWRCARSRLG